MREVFELKDKDVMGRIGRLRTAHGVIETPAILPVVRPGADASRLRKFGAQIIITNAYLIYRSPELRNQARDLGVHRLLGWDGALMTDSGSYQLYEYRGIEVENSEIVRFQQEIGSDIGVPLDIPSSIYISHSRARAELDRTLNRLREARELIDDERDGMILAGTIQGSIYPDLREYAAREASRIGFDLYPIGGVVPLMEQYRYGDLVRVILHSKINLEPSAPIHLFGAGHPMVFALAVALGCDLFDSAAYALYASDGRYLSPSGTYFIEKMEYLPCSCPVCSERSPEDLRSDKDLLADHNLYTSFEEIRRIKEAIREKRLWELVQMRVRSHPSLLEGLKSAVSFADLIERFDPISKTSFFYSGPESSRRPEVIRYSNRLDRFELGGTVLITTERVLKQLNIEHDHLFLLKPPFGPYPVELSETYPVGPSEIPKTPDHEAMVVAGSNVRRLIELNPDVRFIIACEQEWEGYIGDIEKEQVEVVWV
ncbi:MAG TPA: tRNA guanosine(15) transglycosylase TgtA [Candidatus Syntrophoarchaeum butanivorans]|uniref:tRNA-guanine(15) transglycosylase n=1 Tax=Candidatus Syntropharchaeum butanivorans TaxID=1839936 RepID=A0A7C0X4R6_9EURY|nr:MAG: tRNA guanosine(15) transglycosylase TgtA [Candidatus Syntrophoarchaeum sp. WYZ-LMO15]HDM36706.1 tRNA guanosine(15) transglycosylase TgtA [Candidatus Syntrophoarchaeum butanivorans]